MPIVAALAAALSNIDYACELAEFEHLRDDPYTGLVVRDGEIVVPEEPGSGVWPRAER